MNIDLRLLMATACAALTTVTHGATPSFQCSRASTWIEKTVCAQDRLAGLDLEMASVYARLLRTPDTLRRRQVEADQRKWWGSRAACQRDDHPIQCLETTYVKRIAEMRQDKHYPGDKPVVTTVVVQEASVKTGGSGWTRELSIYARAINRCRADARADLAGVVRAWPEDGGENIAMWLRTKDARMLLCHTGKRGDGAARLRERVQSDELPVAEASLRFQAPAASTSCPAIPVLDVEGKDFGWIVEGECW